MENLSIYIYIIYIYIFIYAHIIYVCILHQIKVTGYLMVPKKMLCLSVNPPTVSYNNHKPNS